MKVNSATFVTEVTVTDPDTKAQVQVSIFKHDTSGGMFGVDASFIVQMHDDDDKILVADPFNNNSIVELAWDMLDEPS